MKHIGISQRVEEVRAYGERRDCLDQRWSTLAGQLGWILHPLPNTLTREARSLIQALQLDGIILSGGNTLCSLEPDAENTASERDQFESALLDAALETGIPLLGVCRGMQMINACFNGNLSRLQGHAGTRHALLSTGHDWPFPDDVNSFHDWGIPAAGLGEQLSALAHDEAGNIEALSHSNGKILGIMWHPEREQPFNPLDVQLLQKIFI